MQLILCEKPSQARDIAAAIGATQRGDGVIYGANTKVTWAYGHLLSQAKPEVYQPELKSWDLQYLPVLPHQWQLEPKKDSEYQYKIIRGFIEELTANDTLIIATDADREGEVIARELFDRVDCKAQVKRLWLSALDAASIKKAFANLRDGKTTETLYFSGLGRQRADWLSGMNMTMALTHAFGTGGKEGTLHCGRVQSPTLNLIVRRERQIRDFKPTPYYTLKVKFKLHGTEVPMQWQTPDTFKNQDGHVTNPADIEEVSRAVSGQAARVISVQTSREHKAPPRLFYLGSLQQEASKKYGIKVQATLDICQSLYEKHKATTYPRTDAEYLPGSMYEEAKSVLGQLARYQRHLSEVIAQANARANAKEAGITPCFNDGKVTGHHAIIPTNNPNVDMSAFSKEERIIYDLICKRYIAQFLPDYEFDKTVLVVECAAHQFKTTGKVERIPGWQAVYAADKASLATHDGDNIETEADDTKLPPAQEGDPCQNTLCEPQQAMTKPPQRYTEDTLLKAMESIDKEIDDERLRKIMQNKEKAGIGTDATRGNIIESLFLRQTIANQKKYLVPTEKGEQLIQVLERYAPDMIDPVLTAVWEDKLNQIEHGTHSLFEFELGIGDWLKALIASIREASRTNSDPRIGNSHPPHPCPDCGKDMFRHESKYKKGEFYWSCSGYKDSGCKTTLSDNNGKPGAKKVQQPVSADHKCQACGAGLIRREGISKKTAKPYVMWSCSGYPKCKAKPLSEKDGRPDYAANKG